MTRSVYRRLRALAGRRPERSTRREFLSTSLAATAGLMLPRGVAAAAHPSGRHAGGKRVVVVGAGFAGLACAHELRTLGYDVTVVEARDRVGGRVRSSTSFVPGRTVEIGAELIGSNHPTWIRFQHELGLEFLELGEDETLEQPVWIGGRRLAKDDAARLLDEMDTAFAAMDADAAAVVEDEPWQTPGAAALDARSTADWLRALDASKLCKAALAIELCANNGQELHLQSYLGNLCQVKGGGGAKAYRDESEVYRCKGGNQQLAEGLLARIGADRVVLDLPVSRIDFAGKGAEVHCRDGRTIACDDVVLAVPPSVWSKIEFAPALPASLAPQMGSNVKFFLPLRSRFWRRSGCEQYGLGDGRVSMTWEGTDAQEGDDRIVMVAFSGASAAKACASLAPAERDAVYLEELAKLYPGIEAEVAGKTMFADWGNEPWTRASYSFPAPGQITTMGPVLHRGLGRLHFAGEHACYKYVGYMEGALHSGVALAQRLALRDRVAPRKASAPSSPVR